jgi:leucyl-tRNA synthetase
VRASFQAETDISEDSAKNTALNRHEIKKWIEGKEVKRVIYVPGKVVNIVVA